ncbi:RCC1 domain-containing protein [Microbacterium sp. VKM Ac-2923]|uniref:RCC1 domain-containing protein n=1 Tax=Microbacterium sp. VKM Ac-2923 TaxID=2929476 RepID=UPI001FB33CE5|nr:RCC1 domain-containing protein [Microbacterium sp. VKM Ac-2923]MCJ1707581.1 hypothetical protein [Microbacterium sp. VKM Ac-2923]
MTFDESRIIPRRTLVAAAGWAVPAIAVTTASPAFASSGQSVNVSTPSNQAPASGPVTATSIVTNAAGQAVAGQSVSFTGPSGSSFIPATATTDGAGAATSTLDLATPWATPGSSVTISAVTGSGSASRALRVVGSNAVVAGRSYSATPGQTEFVFPSPVASMISSSVISTIFLALLVDGTVWAKGGNDSGQLGDGTTTARSTWAVVPGLTGVTQIAAGSSTIYALLSNRTVKAWGNNAHGQIGDGTSGTNRLGPTVVSTLTNVSSIAAGNQTGYAVVGGIVKAWGWNSSGQVGDGGTSDRLTPTTVGGISGGVTQVAGGSACTFALLSNGTVMAWGDNAYGQMGDGTTGADRLSAGAVPGLSNVTQIAAGVGTGYALRGDGSVKAWGLNTLGRIGDGTTVNKAVPTQVSGLTSGVTEIAAGAASAHALVTDGSVRSWGYNYYGQLGDGTKNDSSIPVTMALPAGRTVRRLNSSSASMTATVVMSTS